MTNQAEIALIGLGANVASPDMSLVDTIDQAIEKIPVASESNPHRSRFFETPCFPAGAGPDYVNAAITLKTLRTPRQLLDDLHKIEADFGRERAERWGQRTLDLDLLAYGDLVFPDGSTYQSWVDLPPEQQRLRAPDEMILPHPRLHERAFVLIPLNDIAPDWRHPVLNRTIAEFCAALPKDEVAAIIPL